MHDNGFELSSEMRKSFKRLLKEYVQSETECISRQLAEEKSKKNKKNKNKNKEEKLKNFNYDFLNKIPHDG